MIFWLFELFFKNLFINLFEKYNYNEKWKKKKSRHKTHGVCVCVDGAGWGTFSWFTPQIAATTGAGTVETRIHNVLEMLHNEGKIPEIVPFSVLSLLHCKGVEFEVKFRDSHQARGRQQEDTQQQ